MTCSAIQKELVIFSWVDTEDLAAADVRRVGDISKLWELAEFGLDGYLDEDWGAQDSLNTLLIN